MSYFAKRINKYINACTHGHRRNHNEPSAFCSNQSYFLLCSISPLTWPIFPVQKECLLERKTEILLLFSLPPPPTLVLICCSLTLASHLSHWAPGEYGHNTCSVWESCSACSITAHRLTGVRQHESLSLQKNNNKKSQGRMTACI